VTTKIFEKERSKTYLRFEKVRVRMTFLFPMRYYTTTL